MNNIYIKIIPSKAIFHANFKCFLFLNISCGSSDITQKIWVSYNTKSFYVHATYLYTEFVTQATDTTKLSEVNIS
jgi:hypothetical protein